MNTSRKSLCDYWYCSFLLKLDIAMDFKADGLAYPELSLVTFGPEITNF